MEFDQLDERVRERVVRQVTALLAEARQTCLPRFVAENVRRVALGLPLFPHERTVATLAGPLEVVEKPDHRQGFKALDGAYRAITFGPSRSFASTWAEREAVPEVLDILRQVDIDPDSEAAFSALVYLGFDPICIVAPMVVHVEPADPSRDAMLINLVPGKNGACRLSLPGDGRALRANEDLFDAMAETLVDALRWPFAPRDPVCRQAILRELLRTPQSLKAFAYHPNSLSVGLCFTLPFNPRDCLRGEGSPDNLSDEIPVWAPLQEVFQAVKGNLTPLGELLLQYGLPRPTMGFPPELVGALHQQLWG